jgi:hypothetical protein
MTLGPLRARSTVLLLLIVAGCSGRVSSRSTAIGFVHPGLLHTEADFQRMREKVAAGASPWVDGWNRLVANRHASLGWTPRPHAIVYRNQPGQTDNYMDLANDVAAAYACALRWKVSGDAAYADKAVQIMNAWSSTLTGFGVVNGSWDGYLVAGIQGYQFANVGEIMRSYPGLSAADLAAFQAMMKGVFYPMVGPILTGPSSVAEYSNWDLCKLAAAFAIGVLCDDPAIVDAALTYFKTGLGNGGVRMTVYYLHPGHLGQPQEAGRDQGHDTLSIAHLTALCEMAWNQGYDLYGYDDNRVLAAAEYVAKGNLYEPGTTLYPAMPFAWYTNGYVVNTTFATGSQGSVRPEWTLIYNHYVNRRGLAAPFVQRFMEQTTPEGGGGDYGPNSGGYDQLGYGTLAYTRDPIANGAPPSGLTAEVSQGNVVLSWWGTAHATSYDVKRSATSGGPYASIASGVTDPRTYTDAPGSGTFYYVVAAATPTGETAASQEVRAITAVQLHARLSFDEGTGANAADASGNGHAGTLVGGASWATGKTGAAASLDGSTGYVALPAGLVTDLADFTVAAWVYWKATRTWERLFDFGTGTGQYMMLTPRAGSGNVRFAVTLNTGVGEQSIEGAGALPTGRWVHVAVTLAGGTGTLYVDGVAVGTNASMVHAPFRLGPTSQNWIGRSQYAADPHLNGLVDDFRVYRGALTAAEVAALAAP